MKKRTELEEVITRCVRSLRLEDVDALPEVGFLAEKLDLHEEDVRAALRNAVRRGEFVRDEEGRLILSDPPVIDDNDMFSFASSADLEGTELYTVVTGASVLPPSTGHRVNYVERLARRALGINSDEECLLIARTRLIEGEPRVLHRAFLDPKRFPTSFLKDHDFATDSLIQIYQKYGYSLKYRNTRLTARLPTREEEIALGCRLDEPLLEAKQELFAVDSSGRQQFIIEFLDAAYKRWSYRIEKRAFQERKR